MRMAAILKAINTLLIVWLALFAIQAHAAVDSSDVLDNVLVRYQTAASGWAGTIMSAATWLFWTLVLISMIWTFGMMALRKADIGEFFAEFVRFTIFTGFFWWLLSNGPTFASSIYDSLRQLAGSATGLGQGLSPSGVVDVGFAIFDKVVDQSSIWSPVNSAAGIVIAGIILVILALVGVNMLLLLISGWVLAYAGVFFLGFGGSRWTSDMAINYYKTVLGIAAQLFVMVLIVGIGKTFLDDYYGRMSEGITIKELGVMLIVAVILLVLVNKLPGLIAGIITGASVGGAGIGTFGAGAALGAAGMAAAAAATGGAVLAAGAANAAGGAQALMAAFSKANQNVAAGTDVLSSFGGTGSSGYSAGAGSEASTGNTPFAQAAGFSPNTASDAGTNMGVTTGESPSGESLSGDQGNGSSSADDKGGSNTASGSQTGGDSGSSSGQQRGKPSFMAAAAKAGRITADAGANLAKGTGTVAKAKASSIKQSAMERIAETTGGKIATAIKAQGSNGGDGVDQAPGSEEPTFANNNLASGNNGEADPESEVAAFRDRGTTAS